MSAPVEQPAGKPDEVERGSNNDKGKGKAVAVAEGSSDEEEEASGPVDQGSGAAASTVTGKKKKKSKRKKLKDALTPGFSSGSKELGEQSEDARLHKALEGLGPEHVQALLDLNPALKGEIAAGDESAVEALKRLKLTDIMTGLASSGKNVKDMGAYKFWSTQPVMKLDDKTEIVEDGPIKTQKVEDVPQDPSPLVEGFEWCTVDLTNSEALEEVRELLFGHYVEDDEAMFRFNYSASILKWAMMPPEWKSSWHRGVRATQSKKLVAFISGVPMTMRVRENHIRTSEVNFLCVHKKLRSKRLTPLLIKEVTRQANLDGVFQGIYTGGSVLPTPVSTARYFHRALDWQKLWEVGFSPLPANSKPQYQVRKYALPESTSVRGLREMTENDVAPMQDLLSRYLTRFELVPDMDIEDVRHWFVHQKAKGQLEERVIWTYVVDDPNSPGRITDMFSFYALESTVIQKNANANSKHRAVRAAYLFYYATETGLAQPYNREAHKTRLTTLVSDALILAKKQRFDVFNALSIMDNGMFLEPLKFGYGDGQLHFYLFNYRCRPIAGGVAKDNRIDAEGLSGVGFAML